ncbi:MAG: type II secretion system protein GspM [Desulfobulbaceae bacterium]|nr:type II secretion system protein GspM [Desulfobulbaceae bacterium]
MTKISKRDRLFLLAGGAFLILFIMLQFVVFPLFDNRERMRRGIAEREKGLVEMKALQARYRDLHSQANTLVDQLDRRTAGFSLFAFLEQNATRTDVKKNIAYMRPSELADEGPFKEIYIELKLQGVTLKQLVDFLQLIESPENIVALKRISIQENLKEKATLDVILQVVSLDRNPAGGMEQGI